uniref:RRM domain-containing protein n=1 Tax=Sarcophilus harrisii TaxID=9305 RepID=A0A7N4PN84_SARHA
MNEWMPIAKEYDPLKAGSIDGTDEEPHDRAIWRAIRARYVPNKGVSGDPYLTLFVGRLNLQTTEEKLKDVFSRYGDIRKLRLVRDVVTGFSKRYAFIERGKPSVSGAAGPFLLGQMGILVGSICSWKGPYRLGVRFLLLHVGKLKQGQVGGTPDKVLELNPASDTH